MYSGPLVSDAIDSGDITPRFEASRERLNRDGRIELNQRALLSFADGLASRIPRIERNVHSGNGPLHPSGELRKAEWGQAITETFVEARPSSYAGGQW